VAYNIYHAPDADDALTATEAQLAQMINDYRAQSGLAPVRLSSSLSMVAARHDEDILFNFGGYQTGLPGTSIAHSWSDAAYNALNPATFSAVWSAPQRLGTAYPGNGYEILAGYAAPYTATTPITPAVALAGWQNSASHNALLLNLGAWGALGWNAMGIGIEDGVASVWFGTDTDPAGSPAVLLQGSYRDYAVQVTAGGIRVTDSVAGRDPAFTIPNASTLAFADGSYDVAAGRFTSNVPVGFTNATTGAKGAATMDPVAAGGPSFLKYQYIYDGAANLAFATSQDSVFIHSGTGNDAIQVSSGRNVLDGGLGSNFLTGGSGQDTFFTDARSPGVVWNTICNFKPGDGATLWGFTQGVSSYCWDDAIGGAAGAQGATLRANIVGGAGRSGDGVDASITFAGVSVDQAKGFTITTGAQQAGSYLYITM
jgi:Ca2+-binding RTX toxin-like protein